MSGPIVSRAQTPGGGFQTGATVVCVVCNRTDKLLRCSRCKAVFYCTKEHQRRDWKRHKEFCATHSLRSIESDAISPPNTNSLLEPTKEDPSHGNHQLSNIPLVSNLNEIPVSETTRGSSTPSDLYHNAKHLGDSNKRGEKVGSQLEHRENQSVKKKPSSGKSRGTRTGRSDGWTSPITYEGSSEGTILGARAESLNPVLKSSRILDDLQDSELNMPTRHHNGILKKNHDR